MVRIADISQGGNGAPSAQSTPGSGGGGYQSRGLHQAEIDEYSQLFHGRKMSWSNVRLDNSTGAGGRPFTWKWPWSKQVTVHLGGYYSPDPILGASEAAATLAHELGHAVDFAGGWFGRGRGRSYDDKRLTITALAAFLSAVRCLSYLQLGADTEDTGFQPPIAGSACDD